jgi:monovalent cation:H+ antiporter-2, CPA2 family
MHLAPLILDLAIILVIAGAMSLVFHKLKQPVVLGYILAGVIVGPHTPPFQLVNDIPSINTLAELGVIFLMFNLGLEFSFRKLLSVGLTGGVSATLELIFFLPLGYAIGKSLGWSTMDSIFLGAMLFISSTTIIIKALEDLKLKTHRFASLIFGVLIVEDLYAILLIVGLTTVVSSGNFSVLGLASAGLNLVIVIGSWFVTGYYVIPRLMTYLGRRGNDEMITLVSIGLCLSLVVLATYFGYSAALGAFIMGSILAETNIIHRIETLMKPLRDLFGAIFFISIGLLIDPSIIWEYKTVILLLSMVIIFGKIGINTFGALATGNSFKNSMQVGFGLAQIGEFSFIIASLGLALKATSPKLYPIAVAVSLITTFTTPYLIRYSGNIADSIERRLPWRLKNLINDYVSWCEHNKDGDPKYREIFTMFFRWFANGIVLTFVFNFCFENIPELLTKYFPDLEVYGQYLTLVTAFLFSLPFIWGMVFTSKRNYLSIRQERNFSKAAIVTFLPILTSIWIVILSARHFPVKYIAPFVGLFLIGIYFLLFRRLESYYRWIEKTFVSTFSHKKRPAENESLRRLAPWDSHLVSVVVHPNAQLINRNLLKANLRQRFGINIVAINRGLATIVAPKPQELILPNDTLVILGTDEQIDKARPELEMPALVVDNQPETTDYRLRHLKVSETSTLAGSTIRNSGIRERFHAMVVGIERAQKRIVNPDTDMQLEVDDVVWVVGEQNSLDELFKTLA